MYNRMILNSIADAINPHLRGNQNQNQKDNRCILDLVFKEDHRGGEKEQPDCSVVFI